MWLVMDAPVSVAVHGTGTATLTEASITIHINKFYCIVVI